jgi:hypothetical protein
MGGRLFESRLASAATPTRWSAFDGELFAEHRVTPSNASRRPLGVIYLKRRRIWKQCPF